MSKPKDIVTRLEADESDLAFDAAVTIVGLRSENAGKADYIGELRSEIRALRSALRECAEDLAAEINARVPLAMRLYPSESRKYDRDMEPVLRARALLAPSDTEIKE